MSPERTHSYRRVIQTLDELGPSKLLASEQDRIRQAADNLIFSSDLHADDAAREALQDVERLCTALVESGRWTRTIALTLEHDIAGCGPEPERTLEAA
jgi:hypothetical protein